jgi:prepilin-type N-terminal cleavage/methylation domain-containing protein
MKIQHPRRKTGFTLVELLVVITIIAVLSSLAFVGGKKAMQNARRVTALTMATAIEQSVNNFVSEYGSYPKLNIEGDDVIGTTDKSSKYSVDFLNALLAIEKIDKPLNGKGLKFLTVVEGKSKKGGLIYVGGGAASDTAQVSGLYDPWGGPYLVQFDGDFDEAISARTAAQKKATIIRGRKCVVWSNGEDNTTDQNNKGKVIDDVKTWK